MLEVDMRYKQMAKSDQVKIEKWVTFTLLSNMCVQSKLLCSNHSTTSLWKRNRNLYAMLLLD